MASAEYHCPELPSCPLWGLFHWSCPLAGALLKARRASKTAGALECARSAASALLLLGHPDGLLRRLRLLHLRGRCGRSGRCGGGGCGGRRSGGLHGHHGHWLGHDHPRRLPYVGEGLARHRVGEGLRRNVASRRGHGVGHGCGGVGHGGSSLPRRGLHDGRSLSRRHRSPLGQGVGDWLRGSGIGVLRRCGVGILRGSRVGVLRGGNGVLRGSDLNPRHRLRCGRSHVGHRLGGRHSVGHRRRRRRISHCRGCLSCHYRSPLGRHGVGDWLWCSGIGVLWGSGIGVLRCSSIGVLRGSDCCGFRRHILHLGRRRRFCGRCRGVAHGLGRRISVLRRRRHVGHGCPVGGGGRHGVGRSRCSRVGHGGWLDASRKLFARYDAIVVGVDLIEGGRCRHGCC
mmetsp:Transcript_38036/g.80871  ORF Transcript_38036/g.80871 Transcript_38036/m.80871 type:complete len:399 (-) Transcript_38036:69-1265(-)